VSSYAQPTFNATLRCFTQGEGLPFQSVLSQEQILRLCEEEGVHFGEGEGDVYSPPVTLWAWLSQCLSASKCCVAAVARVIVLRVALGLPPCSAATGGYCKARAKLPERFLKRLTLLSGEQLEDQAPDCWRWKSRRVLLADGAECSMPDTPENQKEYPQSGSQKPGLGFPMIRLVVLLCFATAGLVGCAMGPCKGKETGETALFRQMLGQVRKGDVVVADRYYCSYWLVALLLLHGADVAFRLHQRRHYDFRRGKRLGKGDHVVSWSKPERPDWMDEQTYAAIPDTLQVREVRVRIAQPGCRVRQIIVATTLKDAGQYSHKGITDLYHYRWHVELDIRAIKQTLQMDILSCQTPEMVRKEVWAHLLAYNLVRAVMAQAARKKPLKPREVSFAGAVQTVNAFRWLLLLLGEDKLATAAEALLVAVGTHKVGDRPGRCEPRKKKRRPKGFPLLMKPRAQERAALLGQNG
jgi:DDE family transposase